jgi:hypothetical protein
MPACGSEHVVYLAKVRFRRAMCMLRALPWMKASSAHGRRAASLVSCSASFFIVSTIALPLLMTT